MFTKQLLMESVRQSLLQRVALTTEELDLFCAALQQKRIKKNKLIHVEGAVLQNVYFVAEGLLRMYTQSSDFEEQTFEFCYEHTWLADLKSLQNQTPSTINIETIEDSELYALHADDVQRLHRQIPALEKFSRKHAEEKYIEAMLRLQELYHPNLKAKDRYLSFLKHYPMLENRVPMQQLASYLGIVPETLSRIKRETTITK